MTPDSIALCFPKGARVRYHERQAFDGAFRRSLVGRTATVVRPVKSRRVVTLKWDDDGSWYDALPTNLERID